MKNIKAITLFLTVIVLSLSSCNKFLDVQPEDRILQDDVFKDESSVNSALNGIYLNLAKPELYGGQLTMSTIDVMAQYYNPVESWKQMASYNYKDGPLQDTYNSIWQSAYVAILNTNSFLARTGKSQGVLSTERKDLLMGEVYGLRAFIHFDLLRLFGPVYLGGADKTAIPYLTAATAKIQPLLTAKAVTDSILADLDRAELLLKDDPIRMQGVVATTNIDPNADFVRLRNRRFNYYAVLGLKARVLLYRGDKAAAFVAAKQVIEEAGKWFPWTAAGSTLPNLSSPDRVFSPEVIFGLQNYDLYNQQRILFAAEILDANILAPVSKRLLEIFENNENDYRMRVNWSTGAAAGKAYKTFVKYQDVGDKTLLFRNLQPLIRISELYYIAAECTTDRGLALAYINTVRKNRGLSDLNGNIDLETVLQNEYRKEFWGEGQTFFYYKRKAVATISGGLEGVNMTMGTATYVVPLPLSEIQNR